MDLTNEQREVLEPLIPYPVRRPDGRGRPWRDSRSVLNGILWALRTGAPWRDLPERYPPYQTRHRRFQRCNDEGVLDAILRALAEDLKEQGGPDPSECFIDGTFAGAKKGADRWERPNGARVRSSRRYQTLLAFLSAHTRLALPGTRSRS
jgi:transposase